MLGDLYTEWNSKINVISRKDIDQLYTRHILHSLAIGKMIQFKEGSKLLDVGTGGGFPGIPLAILFPECQFTLVDSIGKKIKVVDAVSKAIGLENVTAIHARAEDVDGKFDFVVSRAVTRLKRFMGWINKKFSTKNFNPLDNGVLYLKGGNLEEELSEVQKVIHTTPLSEYFEEEEFNEKYIVYVPAI